MHSKDALVKCLGWRLEGGGNAAQDRGLTLRYGHLFRLRLAMSSTGQQTSCTEGILELAPTGVLSRHIPCHNLTVLAGDCLCSKKLHR